MTIGPDLGGRVERVADDQRVHGLGEARAELVGHGSTTMNRLAAMHDWPLFCTRAVTAVRTAASRSADGSTMKGSEPPSSSTLFLSACAGRRRPPTCRRRSLPVSVTAAIRGSSMSVGDVLATRRTGW